MKIAVNTRFLVAGKLEGVGRYTYEVLRRLVKERPEDTFYFFFDRPFDNRFIFAKNVKGFVIQPPARHPFLFFLWFEFGVTKKLKDLRADLFISPDGFLSLRSTIPTITVVHDIAHVHFPEHIPLIQRWYYKYFMARFVNRARQVITVSHFSREDIIRQYRITPEKVLVSCNGPLEGLVPLSIPEKAAARKKFAEGLPYFLYVGAIHPRKNPAGLIQAFDQFKARTGAPHKLILAGRKAWMLKELQSIYQHAAYRDDILFPGFVPESDLPSLYGGAFALVYVSYFEGFGIPILEAMKAGVPVITSNTSSMPEVGGDAALLVDPADTTSIAEKMQKLWETPDWQQSLIIKGLQQAKKFTWEKAMKVVNQAIETEKRHQAITDNHK